MMQIYMDDNGNKVGMVEKGEDVEFVDAVDFDSVFDCSHVFDFLCFFYFSDFLRVRGGEQSEKVLTLYKKKVDKV